MNKLKVFSEKMKDTVVFEFDEFNQLVTPDGLTEEKSGILFRWNNSSGSWVDKGWNNSSGSWVDKGWNNSSGSWVDKGWNNSSGAWQDKGWSNSSGNWGDSGGSGGGCYLTTACVHYQGLSDDCHELNVLRKYRDILVREDEGFRAKVLDYYRKAPLIVQHVEADSTKDAIWNDLFNNMITPCVEMLESGRIDEAKKLYLDSYSELTNRYLTN